MHATKVHVHAQVGRCRQCWKISFTIEVTHQKRKFKCQRQTRYAHTSNEIPITRYVVQKNDIQRDLSFFIVSGLQNDMIHMTTYLQSSTFGQSSKSALRNQLNKAYELQGMRLSRTMSTNVTYSGILGPLRTGFCNYMHQPSQPVRKLPTPFPIHSLEMERAFMYLIRAPTIADLRKMLAQLGHQISDLVIADP